MDLYDDNTLVCFDIENRFHNYPVNETIKIMIISLNKDEKFKSKTNFPFEVRSYYKVLCVECNCFVLKYQIYRQDEGIALGSPLSPILALS